VEKWKSMPPRLPIWLPRPRERILDVAGGVGGPIMSLRGSEVKSSDFGSFAINRLGVLSLRFFVDVIVCN